MHVVYYLSRALAGPELRYSYIEKLALAVVYAVQRPRHYILLRTTTMVVVVNPFSMPQMQVVQFHPIQMECPT